MAATKTPKAATQAATQELFEVTLAKPHTHKRQRLQPGAKIEVDALQKAYLEKHGIVGDKQEEASNG